MKIARQEMLDFSKKLFWLGVVVYGTFILGVAVNKNYQAHRAIIVLRQKIASVEVDIERQKLLNTYYQSTTFKELEARRRLGLKKPDEKVFILPQKESQQAQNPQQSQAPAKQTSSPESNPRKWLRFLLGV